MQGELSIRPNKEVQAMASLEKKTVSGQKEARIP